MDTTSTTSLLSVDATSLEAILLNISTELKCHDAIISKLPKIESAQSDLRKEINKLRLAIDSINTIDDVHLILPCVIVIFEDL